MTIIFDKGKEFHIEFHQVSIVVTNGAEEVASAVINLDRPGDYLGGSVVMTNATANAAVREMGPISLRDAAGGEINFGEPLSGFIVQISKAADAGGGATIVITIMLYIRGT